MSLFEHTIGSVSLHELFRPGGGGSYSGGSGSGGGGGGGGGDGIVGALLGFLLELVFRFLLWLCIEHPAIGIPLVILIICVFVAKSYWDKRNEAAWSVGGGASEAPTNQRALPQGSFELVRANDPSFSRVVFEDFAYGLYAAVHAARGAQRLELMSAYLLDDVLRHLKSPTLVSVEHIVIGAMHVSSIVPDGDGGITVTLDFESNFTERTQAAATSYFHREQWSLFRARGAVSRQPSKARIFGCPGCGAPQDGVFAGQCKYCNRVVATGAFDWLIVHCEVLAREQRPPMLTASVAEQGTNLPTIVDPSAQHRFAEIVRKDPSMQWASFTPRVHIVFHEFQQAWSARDLQRMRALMTDCLFDMQSSWVQAYVSAKLWNVITAPELLSLEPARVETDAYFDAITVRVFARSCDFTVDEKGTLISGSRTTPRAYSEYWTFIRGTTRRAQPKADTGCPNCGAPLKVNMTGQCTHCGVKVTSGDFDWVLSRIEQDEAYTG
jgi:hypothetical protein